MASPAVSVTSTEGEILRVTEETRTVVPSTSEGDLVSSVYEFVEGDESAAYIVPSSDESQD